jgi:hypothetical protein
MQTAFAQAPLAALLVASLLVEVVMLKISSIICFSCGLETTLGTLIGTRSVAQDTAGPAFARGWSGAFCCGDND